MGAGAIIGAVIGGGAFAAGSTLFGTSLVASALTGAALGNIFDRRGPQASPTYALPELENTRSQALPIPVIYGKVKVAGNIIYHRVDDERKTIAMAVGISEGEIDGVEQILVDDVPIQEIEGAQWAVYHGTPDQQPGVAYATMTTRLHPLVDLTYTAKLPGEQGLNISIQYFDFGPDRDLEVRVSDGNYIMVQLATGPEYPVEDPGTGETEYRYNLLSTVSDVMAAIRNHPVAGQLVDVALGPEAEEDQIVIPMSRTYLDKFHGVPILSGERWPYTAVIAAEFPASSLATSNPTITAVVRGMRVPVWTGSQWVNQYTNNPAWALLDFLRSKRYGVGIEDQRIDFNSFAVEAGYCDELVPDGRGGEEPRFRLDYVIDYEASSLDVIEDMLATFRAYLLYTDGKLRLKIEKSEAPVHAFTMDNIVSGSFSYSKASRKDIPNRVVAEWVDPRADYERVETAYDNEIDQDRRGEIYSRTVTLLGVTRPGQAGRMARFYHDSAYWANTFCEFRVGIDALHCEVGDVVQVSHDVPGWDKKFFRILEIEEGEDDEAILRCREYAPAIYHDRGVVYQPGKQTTLPNPVAAPPHVENLHAFSATRRLGDGTTIPIIRVTWTEPAHAFYAGAVVYWRKQDGPAWQRSPLSEAPTYDIALTDPGDYEVRVVSENRGGIRSAFEMAPSIQVSVNPVVPDNVTGLVADFATDDFVLAWEPTPGAAAYRVQILSGSSLRRETTVTGNSYRYTVADNRSDGTPPARILTARVWAVNAFGIESLQAAEETAEHPVPPAPTGVSMTRDFRGVVVTHDTSPGAAGYEVHVSTTPDFTPSQSTLQGSGDNTIWTIPSLAPAEDPERIHYAKVIAYDTAGHKSEPSAEVSSPPGRLADIDVPDELIVTRMIAQGAITEMLNVEHRDPIETAEIEYVQMPGMELTVPIEGPCVVWYSCLAPVNGQFDISTLQFWGAGVRMLLNDEQVWESVGLFNSPGLLVILRRYDHTLTYPLQVRMRLEWKRTGSVYDPTRTVTAEYRGMMAMLWKR